MYQRWYARSGRGPLSDSFVGFTNWLYHALLFGLFGLFERVSAVPLGSFGDSGSTGSTVVVVVGGSDASGSTTAGSSTVSLNDDDLLRTSVNEGIGTFVVGASILRIPTLVPTLVPTFRGRARK